jgi:WD40 repeat protein
VVAGDFNGRWIGWDVENGREQFNIKGHGRKVTGLDFSPDGTRLASSSWDGSIKLWETSRWQAVTTLQEHPGRVTSVSFSRDGQWLSSTGNRRVVVRRIKSSR